MENEQTPIKQWTRLGEFRLTGWNHCQLTDEQQQAIPGGPMRLWHEGDNPHDACAMRVTGLPNKGDTTLEGVNVGYLPADAARVLVYMLSEGYAFSARAFVGVPKGGNVETFMLKVYVRRA